MSKDCRKKASCSDCSLKHPAILHVVRENAASERIGADDSSQGTRQVTNALVSAGCRGDDHTGAGKSDGILPIVPVQIKHRKGTEIIKTYAFLDQGSTATFCTEDLAKKLNIRGRKFLLRTIAQEQKVSSYVLTDLEVCGLEEQEYIQLPNVYTQPDIPAKKANIPQKKDLVKWSYLSRVHLPKLEAEVGLLIGANAFKAMEPWEIISSQNDGPYAVKTALGWVVNGPISRCQENESGDGSQQSFLVNRISVMNIEDMLMKHHNADFPESQCDDRQEHSHHDKQFMHTATTSAQLMDGHFCIKLPLKDDKVKMPCNRDIAEQRLNSLKRKFSRTTDFFQELKAFMNNILEKGCLKSVATEDQAAALVKELMTLCASGGFHLTKWVSNSRVLLGSIPDHKGAAEVKDLDLEHDELPVERALGVQWCTSTDSFRFKINLSDQPCIRRGILYVVSSVYDPMGFLAPLLLPVKLILKDPCKEKKGWDEEIPEKPRRTWKKWLTDLDKLSELSVNRCFKPTAFGAHKGCSNSPFLRRKSRWIWRCVVYPVKE